MNNIDFLGAFENFQIQNVYVVKNHQKRKKRLCKNLDNLTVKKEHFEIINEL